MSEDATTRRVREIILREAARAYGFPRPFERDDFADVCGCGHHHDDHHGKLQEGRCSVCDCVAWHPNSATCPVCHHLWKDGSDCPNCGLTVEEVAEEIAGG